MTKQLNNTPSKKRINSTNSNQKKLDYSFYLSNLIETYSNKKEINEIKKDLYALKINLNSFKENTLT